DAAEESPGFENFLYAAGPSNAQPHQPIVVTLPSALNPWEEKNLREKEQLNEELRRLRIQMEHEQLRENSPVPSRPFQGTRGQVLTPYPTLDQLEPIDNDLNHLKERLRQLMEMVQYHGYLLNSIYPNRPHNFEAGPCNGLDD
ncbi:hypothetical protein QAD02_000070, partial [Eretmocerus hayati]